MSDILREALVSSYTEIIASSPRTTIANFVAAIKTIRSDYTITYMSDKYVTTYIWPLFRKDLELVNCLFNATVNFTTAIPDLGEAVKMFSERLMCFSAQTLIVDDDVLSKSVSASELSTTLANNNWLFYVLCASTHIYLLNEVFRQCVMEE